MNNSINWAHYACLSFLLTSVSACKVDGEQVVGVEPQPSPSFFMTEAEIMENYADASCDPLYTSPEIPLVEAPNNGWFGQIRTTPSGPLVDENAWNSNLDRYLENDAVQLHYPLYLHTLNVPTREFTEGFPTIIGGLIADNSGNTLVERFHLTMESNLKLSQNFEEGTYQLAFLSDDGLRLSLGNEDVLINSTGKHPTKMLCAARELELNHNQVKNLLVEYFQGPRYHIALQFLWRKVEPGAPNDALCGVSGNEIWFDYDRAIPSPKAKYNELLSRGWSVVPATEFKLPSYEPINPCSDERILRH